VNRAALRALSASIALLLVGGVATPAWSSVTTAGSPAAPDTSGALYQVRDGDASYVAPTNGYDDGGVSDYCLLTQDASKAGLTSVVAPNGSTYALSRVYVGDALSAAAGPGGCIAADSTLFVDAGTYRSDLDYYALTKQNFSLVGLGSGAGDPSVTLLRTFSSSSPPDGTVDRYQFSNASDLYFANVILDFAGKNLRNSSAFGYYAVVVGTGTDGFVMQDVVIANVGASNVGSQRNSALNVVYATTGTHHFVGLTVRRVKTTSAAGVVFTNQSRGVYFDDLDVDASLASTLSYGVRVENASTAQLPLVDNMVVFAGHTAISTGFIQVQDYRYDLVGIPADYRYVEYTTSNANGSTGAYRVYKSPPASASNKAVLDRVDGYWLVRQGQTRTVNQQLSDLVAVRNAVSTALSTTPARIPPANIKLAVATPAQVASFTVPNFGAGAPVNVVAVPEVTALGTGTATVPVAAGFTASLGATANSANVVLWNLDFAAVAKYTLTEAIQGINPAALAATDPRDGSYPAGLDLNLADYRPTSTVAAKITASGGVLPSQLRNATFVALASGEPGSVTALDLAVARSSIGVDTTTTATATVPDWYTSQTRPAVGATSGADDPTVSYFTSDPTIATVDQSTGLIAGVGAGTATIYAKAKDAFNNGEIEKPFASTAVRVTSEPQLTVVISADPLASDVAGTVVGYHFLVTNSGNVPLTGVTLTAPSASGLSCPTNALAPAESMECSASHVLTQADVDAGVAHTAADVSGSPRIGDPVTAADSLDVVIPARRGITITDTGPAVFPSGLPGTLQYPFTLTNTSNVTLTEVTVSDPSLASVSCPQTVLAPGQEMACVGVYALPQSVIDTGRADLDLTSSGTAPNGDLVTGSAQDVVTIPTSATIELTSSASAPSGTDAGAVITFTFVVTNSGSVSLFGVTVSDPAVGTVACPTDVLAPGASVVCAATYVVAQVDIDAGLVRNVATVVGASSVAGQGSASASAVTVLTQLPRLGFEQTVRARTTSVRAGTELDYTFRVTNTGNVTLSAVAIDDPTLAGVTCPADSLAPGEQIVCTGAPYLVTAADQASGRVVNTASATAIAGCVSCGPQEVTRVLATASVEQEVSAVSATGGGLAATGAQSAIWLFGGLGLVLLGALLRLGARRRV